MNEDYLWDRSGPPDPEIERLEHTLAPLRYKHRAGLVRERRTRQRAWWLAAAAAVVAAVALSRSTPAPQATAWQVESLDGSATLGAEQAAAFMPLRAGEVLRTGGNSQLMLRADQYGTMTVGPDSELRAATNRQILFQRGQLHAYIWAPPRQFVVETPSARAVDLGCEYTINVDRSGDGLIRVSMGWVAFQFADRESFIPAGAECVTRKRGGPGVPFYEDAEESLRRSLAAWEKGDGGALAGILDAARPRDALTLWHLLTRVGDGERGAVFDRFAQLVDLPRDVTREGVLRKEPHAIDVCWDALGLEDTSWWRGWERRWE